MSKHRAAHDPTRDETRPRCHKNRSRMKEVRRTKRMERCERKSMRMRNVSTVRVTLLAHRRLPVDRDCGGSDGIATLSTIAASAQSNPNVMLVGGRQFVSRMKVMWRRLMSSFASIGREMRRRDQGDAIERRTSREEDEWY